MLLKMLIPRWRLVSSLLAEVQLPVNTRPWGKRLLRTSVPMRLIRNTAVEVTVAIANVVFLRERNAWKVFALSLFGSASGNQAHSNFLEANLAVGSSAIPRLSDDKQLLELSSLPCGQDSCKSSSPSSGESSAVECSLGCNPWSSRSNSLFHLQLRSARVLVQGSYWFCSTLTRCKASACYSRLPSSGQSIRLLAFQCYGWHTLLPELKDDPEIHVGD
jgi:hypothetical protein